MGGWVGEPRPRWAAGPAWTAGRYGLPDGASRWDPGGPAGRGGEAGAPAVEQAARDCCRHPSGRRVLRCSWAAGPHVHQPLPVYPPVLQPNAAPGVEHPPRVVKDNEVGGPGPGIVVDEQGRIGGCTGRGRDVWIGFKAGDAGISGWACACSCFCSHVMHESLFHPPLHLPAQHHCCAPGPA